MENCRELLDGRGAIVDFGYGESPVTTVELASAVHEVNASLRVVGIERLLRRDDRGEGVQFISGDLSSCAELKPTALIRAMNVLRGYREDQVPEIHAGLGRGLIEGGLLIEGSTDIEGHVSVVWLLRKRSEALVREGLLFHTDFTRGFSPWLFRDWLPRELRRSARPGTPIHALLSTWDAQSVSGPADPRERFIASIHGVIEATAWEREHGFVRATAVSGF